MKNMMVATHPSNQRKRSNLNKSSVESFTNDLLENVFTDEELVRSSVTGKPCNATKKPRGCTSFGFCTMDYVRETVHKFFGKASKINSRINKAAQNKITTKRKDNETQDSFIFKVHILLDIV
ncbi:hypothetical protein TSAR_010037 [Trichomalopsis sarcophagae]|uniref:BEN domain-containing protein n=1 Tax=Trichomalopsis sarcophagae TaxID=543379 RepID=A0A232ER82_9HYME|nr:hypothetical protein TSAR_010037 [Trichomalopsis sarcophagae]